MAEKILVTDEIVDAGLKILEDKGFEVDVKIGLSVDELIRIIPDYDGLIVRGGTQVTREVIDAASKLRIIGRAGVTMPDIDIDAATERGIVVCNAPTSNAVSAAELTIAVMLSAARSIAQANASMHDGKWERGRFSNGIELFDKTLGIFGLGRIGSLVAERAHAFGMKVIAYDPYLNPEHAEALNVQLFEDMNDVLERSDFITVHVPKTKETMGMFGPKEYARMKDGVIVVNTSRGGIFNVKALSDFMAAGKIAACALDMFEEEPCLDSPLHEFDNALLTPHLGAGTREALLRASVQIAKHVASGLSGSIVPTAVNMSHVSGEAMKQVGPYAPACEMMGSILTQIAGKEPSENRLTLAGEIAHADSSILKAAALKGLLCKHPGISMVTPVNAKSVAKHYGICIESDSQLEAFGYSSSVMISADDLSIAATLTGESSTPRLVSLLGYKVDMVPGSRSLVFEYPDGPGRMGVIGTILGEEGINITTMQIGTKPEQNMALVFINVEGNVTARVLDRLRREVTNLQNLWLLEL